MKQAHNLTSYPTVGHKELRKTKMKRNNNKNDSS